MRRASHVRSANEPNGRRLTMAHTCTEREMQQTSDFIFKKKINLQLCPAVWKCSTNPLMLDGAESNFLLALQQMTHVLTPLICFSTPSLERFVVFDNLPPFSTFFHVYRYKRSIKYKECSWSAVLLNKKCFMLVYFTCKNRGKETSNHAHIKLQSGRSGRLSVKSSSSALWSQLVFLCMRILLENVQTTERVVTLVASEKHWQFENITIIFIIIKTLSVHLRL